MSEREPATGNALYLVPEPVWEAQASGTLYSPEAFEQDGFIHTTHGDDMVIQVANMFYTGDPRPYLVLDIDLSKVSAETVYEDPEHQFPHIYGPLDVAAVTRVRRVIRGADGQFLGIGGPISL